MKRHKTGKKSKKKLHLGFAHALPKSDEEERATSTTIRREREREKKKMESWVEFPSREEEQSVASLSSSSSRSWETFGEERFLPTAEVCQRTSLAGAQPIAAATTHTSDDIIGEKKNIHPISKDVALRCIKPNDYRLRNLFFSQDVSAYTTEERVRVRTNTFNANGKKPKAELDITSWLMEDSGDGAAVVDVYAVGFQEIVPLQVQKVLKVQDVERDARMWDEKILRCLNNKTSSRNNSDGTVEKYVKITSMQLVGVYITIFVREELIRNGSIRERPISTKVATGFSLGFGTGAMNVKLGNKGGCCALIKIRDTSIAFVCAHLAAGSKEEDAKRRNADAAEILQKCVFAPDVSSEDEQGEDERDFRTLPNSIRWEKPSRARTVHDATVSIFFGDLNYRLNAPKDDVLEHVRLKSNEAELNASSFRANTNNYIPLLRHDQLLNEMQSGNVLPGYREGSIEFPMTYKFKPGTSRYSGIGRAAVSSLKDNNNNNDSEYENDFNDDFDEGENSSSKADDKEEKKKRAPAWCDRVLWKGEDLQLLGYRDHDEIYHSDHKPVSATFDLKCRTVDYTGRLKRMLTDLQRKLDAEETNRAHATKVVLESGTTCDFGEVRYCEQVTRRIQFKFPRNNHGNMVSFSVGFHGRGGSYDDLINDTEDDAPKWVRDITPAKATVDAETSVFVDISAFVSGAETLRSIGPSSSLDAVLVIRAEHCQDAYVALTGVYAQNPIFGAPLRSLPPSVFPPDVPSVVSTLVDALFAFGSISKNDLFTQQSSENERKNAVRNCLRLCGVSQNAFFNDMHSSSSSSLLDDFNALSVTSSSKTFASVVDLALALLEFFHALPEPLFGDGSLFTGCFRDEEHVNEAERKQRLENVLRQSLEKTAHASATYTLAFLTTYVGKNSPSSSIRLESVCRAFANAWFAKNDASTFSLVRRAEIVKCLLSSSTTGNNNNNNINNNTATQSRHHQQLNDLFSTSGISDASNNSAGPKVIGSLLDL